MILSVLVAIGLTVGLGAPARAAGTNISPPATLQAGQSRGVAAAWSGGAPYNVNFQCNVPGCQSFVHGSTTQTSHGTTVQLTPCVQTRRGHSVNVTASSGGTASATSWTQWSANPGGFC